MTDRTEPPVTDPDLTDITLLIDEAQGGSDGARNRLLELVYKELHTIARSQMRSERVDHTLGATALVNESYMRLFKLTGMDASSAFHHRHAFYKAASVAMRRILIDHARALATLKRSGQRKRGNISLDLLQASTESDPCDLLSLDDALSRLEGEDERAAAVVRLRFFGGRQLDEIALILGVSSRTVKRDWEFARARLQQLIEAFNADSALDEDEQ